MQLKSYKETATANLLIVMHECITGSLVRNKTEFAKKIGEYQQNLSSIGMQPLITWQELRKNLDIT